MKAFDQVPIAPGREMSAWVCLVALTLLWSPVWAVAWQSSGMGCCENGMCAAQEHANPSHHHSQKNSSQESPTNCQHHSGSSLTQCTMSCCQESTPSLTAAVIFVLPEPTILSVPARAMATTVNFVPSEFVQSFQPLSPPPRTALFSL
jgi:hypothetical protein